MRFSRIASRVVLCAVFASLAINSASAKPQDLKIVSVFSASSTHYDTPLRVDVVVAHTATALPSVAVHYAPLLNRTLFVGWRMVGAQLTYAIFNTSVFTVNIPSPVYHESLPWNTKIIFYVEARDRFDNVALSCRDTDRWDPYIQDDKFTFVLDDPYPPEILGVEHFPKTPTSEDSVKVRANVTDAPSPGPYFWNTVSPGILPLSMGSGTSKVSLFYSLNEGTTWTRTAMSIFEKIANVSRVGDYGTVGYEVCEAVVPAQKRDSKVVYYLEAYDNAGNKRTSAQMSYQVLPSPEEESRQRQMWMTMGAIAAVAAIAVALVFRRNMFEMVRDVRQMRHKTLAFTILVTLLLVGRMSQWLYVWGHKWLALIMLLTVLEFWSAVDPRLRCILRDCLIKPAREIVPLIARHLTKIFEENPPTFFVAACYVVGFVGAVMVAGLYVVGFFTLRAAYEMANFFATYAFFLLAAGALGQLIWIVHKDKEGEARTTDR